MGFLFAHMSYTWLFLAIILLVVEAMVPGLVSIWFAVGSLAAMIVTMLGAPGWLQILIFIVISGACLALTRPLAMKYVNSKVQPTNADMIIGRECRVDERIDNISGTGAITAGGKVWTAISFNEDVIVEPGTRAVIEKIEGVKAVVKPLDK